MKENEVKVAPRELRIMQSVLLTVANEWDRPVDLEDWQRFSQKPYVDEWERSLHMHHVAEMLRVVAQDQKKLEKLIVAVKVTMPSARIFNKKLFNHARVVLHWWITEKRTPDGGVLPLTYDGFISFAKLLNSPIGGKQGFERLTELRNEGFVDKIATRPVATFMPRKEYLEHPEQLLPEEEERAELGLCGDCKRIIGTMTCEDCGVILCPNCAPTHECKEQPEAV